ncbi:MAG TPA: DsrE family protein [Gaiellales bacterium]|jgi:predicted peroxiredoxin|nr:DsrE family protein [Gaiellales bacterium]
MAKNAKVVISLATGLDDGERVTVALLVGGAALEQGRQVTMFLTKEAVRLALPGFAQGVACDGCPSIPRLLEQFADGGGELLVCPVCFNARKLDESELAANARIGGATPLWEWIGDEPATVFSY